MENAENRNKPNKRLSIRQKRKINRGNTWKWIKSASINKTKKMKRKREHWKQRRELEKPSKKQHPKPKNCHRRQQRRRETADIPDDRDIMRPGKTEPNLPRHHSRTHTGNILRPMKNGGDVLWTDHSISEPILMETRRSSSRKRHGCVGHGTRTPNGVICRDKDPRCIH